MDLRELRARGDPAAPNRPTYPRHPWELARAEVVARLLRRVVGPRVGNILDLGCGDAFVAGYLSDQFPSSAVAAVDDAFDDQTLSAIKDSLGDRRVSLFHSLDEAAPRFQDSIEVVLLLDVLEHVDDDVGLLQSLGNHRLLGRNAYLLATTPALPSLFSAHDRFLGHRRRYTERSLAESCRRAGYTPLATGYFFTTLLLPRWLDLRRERANPGSVDSSALVRDPPRNPTLIELIRITLLLDFEISWIVGRLGLKIPGLSTYALCQRAV